MGSQNIYEYHKIKTLEKFYCISNGIDHDDIDTNDRMRNKINELVVLCNRLAKDLELYKRAYKQKCL